MYCWSPVTVDKRNSVQHSCSDDSTNGKEKDKRLVRKESSQPTQNRRQVPYEEHRSHFPDKDTGRKKEKLASLVRQPCARRQQTSSSYFSAVKSPKCLCLFGHSRLFDHCDPASSWMIVALPSRCTGNTHLYFGLVTKDVTELGGSELEHGADGRMRAVDES